MYKKLALVLGMFLLITFFGGCETVTQPPNASDEVLCLSEFTDPARYFKVFVPEGTKIQDKYTEMDFDYVYYQLSNGKSILRVALSDLEDLPVFPPGFSAADFHTSYTAGLLFCCGNIENISKPTKYYSGYYYTGTLNDPDLGSDLSFIYFVTQVTQYQFAAVGTVLGEEITKNDFLYIASFFTVLKTL